MSQTKPRIAVFATAYDAMVVPRTKQIAPHAIAIDSAEVLQSMGWEVDMYCPEGSGPIRVSHLKNPGLPGIYGSPLERDIKNLPGGLQSRVQTETWIMYEQMYLHQMYAQAMAGEYQAVILHSLERGLVISKLYPTIPTLYILHDPYRDWKKHVFPYFNHPNLYLVPISEFQLGKYQEALPNMQYTDVAYNGLDMDLLEFVEHPKEENLIFVGRITPEKGVHLAVQAALATNKKLLIAGSVHGAENQVYFDQEVKPYLNGQISYLGELDRQAVGRLYGQGQAMLAPLLNDEPFGLTLVESLACGTPVIAFDRGAAKEIIHSGQNGVIVDCVQEMIRAIDTVSGIDRRLCKDSVEQKFHRQNMGQAYAKILDRVLTKT